MVKREAKFTVVFVICPNSLEETPLTYVSCLQTLNTHSELKKLSSLYGFLYEF
jgi:hypothetical protein